MIPLPPKINKNIANNKFKDDDFSSSEEEKNLVKQELGRVREFVSGLSLDDVKKGYWFSKLVGFALNQYVTQVDADYFKVKYPNLPADAVVDARIKMAANYASIEGALTSTAYTGAIATTIGSGGGASPLTLPAGGASFVVDMSYLSYLQLRMIHDIAVLYGVPFDLDDPDDVWKLVKLAFGIKLGETASIGMTVGMPAFIRPVVKKIFSGATLGTLKSLPVVGKYLLQRNIIKFAIPGVTIPVTTAVNRYMSKAARVRAKRLLRREVHIIEVSQRILAQAENLEAFLAVAWWIINIDKNVQDEEKLLLHHLTVAAEETAGHDGQYRRYLDQFRTQIEVDEDQLWEKISSVSGQEAAKLYRSAIIASAVDGKISDQERKLLDRLAEGLGIDQDQALIDEIRGQWK